MVHHVFGRVVRPETKTSKRYSLANGSGSRTPLANDDSSSRPGTPAKDVSSPVKELARLESPAPASPSKVGASSPSLQADVPKLTLESFSQPNPNDSMTAAPERLGDVAARPTNTISIEVLNGDALETPAPHVEHSQVQDDEGEDDMSGRPIPTDELFVKDAFLVFRALCKLSMKSLVGDSELDIRSHAMRSKLLSLHLILTILKSHSDLFTNLAVTIPSSTTAEHTPFLQATKQYLCQCLSRNAVSPVTQVFELSTEIFWCVLKSMRAPLKKEIEVLLNEIFLPILEMRHSTIRQKSLVLGVFIRLCQEPQALVEIYINYDCDRSAPENIYEKLMNIVSKIGQTHFAPPSKEELQQGSSKQASRDSGPAIPPSLSTNALGNDPHHYAGLSPEIKLRRQSLECLVAALKSLVAWSKSTTRGAEDASNAPRQSVDGSVELLAGTSPLELAPSPGPQNPRHSISGFASGSQTPDAGEDDVSKLENEKQRKTMLLDGIKKFNFKPKRGIEYLIQNGFIRSREHEDIAEFLLNNDGLSKAMIGEYLGEGDAENVAIMHAFVDQLDFTGITFTEGLRMYLQTFRLPGEAQKIDRFMLKFAERYMHQNPEIIFANADTAYILAFSVIMLNTDQHNKNLKTKRMTKADFIKNNRGINEGGDLPDDFLGGIFEEIQSNEIILKDEHEGVVAAGGLAIVGRDLQREAFLAQSENMANKTEALLKTMARTQRDRGGVSEHYYAASRIEHVRFMFEVAWMPFLAGLSAQLQETDDMEVVERCLDGLRNAIRIVCQFDMELERNAFVTTLAKFTFLNNLAEMKPKNMEAIKCLLDIAVTDGTNLKASWKEVLTCVSQLERMQLISNGMDVPDLNRRTSTSSRRSVMSNKRDKRDKRRLDDDLGEESRSSQVTVAADKVFTLSQNLSGVS
jgi:brefeldin A-inhibited guanine nucleotide-exchange protein